MCTTAESVYGTSCTDQSGTSAALAAAKLALGAKPTSRGRSNPAYNDIGGVDLWQTLDLTVMNDLPHQT